MATRKGYVEYAKQRDASAGQDGWAKIKSWKDPMGGANNPLMGNSRMKGKAYNSSAIGSSKGNGMDLPDGMSDRTYGNLNKPGDSTA